MNNASASHRGNMTASPVEELIFLCRTAARSANSVHWWGGIKKNKKKNKTTKVNVADRL